MTGDGGRVVIVVVVGAGTGTVVVATTRRGAVVVVGCAGDVTGGADDVAVWAVVRAGEAACAVVGVVVAGPAFCCPEGAAAKGLRSEDGGCVVVVLAGTTVATTWAGTGADDLVRLQPPSATAPAMAAIPTCAIRRDDLCVTTC
jgi:hypothetical protein